MNIRNDLSGPQKFLLAIAVLVTLGLIGKGAQAAFDATAIHKLGQANQKVTGNVRVTGTTTTGNLCLGGADATNDCLGPGLYQIDSTDDPTNGQVLHWNGDGGAYSPTTVYEVEEAAPVNGALLQWNGDAGFYGTTPGATTGITLTASQTNSDAGAAFTLNNSTALSLANQDLLRLQNNGTTKFWVGAAGEVRMTGAQKLCLEATCTRYLNDATTATNLQGALTSNGNNVWSGVQNFRASIANDGAAYSGSLGFDDPIRNLSTTTALFESSAVDATVTNGFTFNNIAALTTGDVAEFSENGAALFRVDHAGATYATASSYAINFICSAGGCALVGNTGQPAMAYGRVADGATAISNKLGANPQLTVAGAKIVSFYNDYMSTEKAYIDLNGRAYFAAGITPDQIKGFGDAGYVWDDLRIPLSGVDKSAVNAPTLMEMMDSTGTGGSTTGVWGWGFSNAREDDLIFDVQLPHGYAVEAQMPLEPHVHWTMITTSTASPAVTWGIECTPFGDLDGSYKVTDTTGRRSHATTTATLNITSGHDFEVGHNIVVAGVTETGCDAGEYNGNFRVTAVTDTTISYTTGTCDEVITDDVGGTVTGYTITKEVVANVATNSQWKNIDTSLGTFRMKGCTKVSCLASCRFYRPNVVDLDEFVIARSVDFHYALDQVGSKTTSTR